MYVIGYLFLFIDNIGLFPGGMFCRRPIMQATYKGAERKRETRARAGRHKSIAQAESRRHQSETERALFVVIMNYYHNRQRPRRAIRCKKEGRTRTGGGWVSDCIMENISKTIVSSSSIALFQKKNFPKGLDKPPITCYNKGGQRNNMGKVVVKFHYKWYLEPIRHTASGGRHRTERN